MKALRKYLTEKPHPNPSPKEKGLKVTTLDLPFKVLSFGEDTGEAKFRTFAPINMNVKACIFDLDGVIVDTAIYHYQAWKRLANSLGFDFTEHDNEQLKGVSRVRSLEIILELGGVTKTAAEQKQLAAQKNEWYVEMISHMKPDEILPGAKEFVQACRDAGIKTALGSASKNSMMILDKIGMTSLFDAIIDGNKVTKAKPDPEVFLKGAEELGVQPADCVVFEDAIAGVEAAKAGGMKAVGIGSREVLKQADMVLSGLSEMNLGLLRNL